MTTKVITVDTSNLVDGLQANVADVLIPVGDLKTAMENTLNAVQDYEAALFEGLSSAPTNPAASKYKLYAKSDGRLYLLDSAGAERQLRSHNYGATVFRSTNQSIPTGTSTAITFDSVQRNTGSVWNAGTPTRLTAPVAGWYEVSANVFWDTNATGIRRAEVRLDGTTTILRDQVAPLSGDGTALNLGRQIYLTAGQYVELMVLQSSGGNLNVLAASAYAQYFSLVYLSEG